MMTKMTYALIKRALRSDIERLKNEEAFISDVVTDSRKIIPGILIAIR